jgi:hypothetical protein
MKLETLFNAIDLFFLNQNITLYIHIQSERKTNIYVTALFTLQFFTVYNLQFTVYNLQFTALFSIELKDQVREIWSPYETNWVKIYQHWINSNLIEPNVPR